jgi:hypothetical protein
MTDNDGLGRGDVVLDAEGTEGEEREALIPLTTKWVETEGPTLKASKARRVGKKLLPTTGVGGHCMEDASGRRIFVASA